MSEVHSQAEQLATREANNPMLAFVHRAWDAAEQSRRLTMLAFLQLSVAETVIVSETDFRDLDPFLWCALCGAVMQENFDFFRLSISRGFV